MANMLKTSGKYIVDDNGKNIQLKGIALGGWLMMEGYMLGGRNIPESVFKEALGSMKNEFSNEFRERFVTKDDAKIIKESGFNCVRLPFNYRLLEEEKGFDFFVNAVKYFTALQIYVILDMHAVPGCQNQDWHSDSTGKYEFFENSEHQKHFYKLWKSLSDRFKDEEYIAAYDIMNEPVTKHADKLKEVYMNTINTIRENKDDHIIFLEGNNWAQQVDFMEGLFKKNVALSIHFYEPSKFTFNQFSNLKYPGVVDGVSWNKKTIGQYLKKYMRFNVPVYVGEFGVGSRCAECHKEFEWVRDTIKVFNSFKFHWTYWTYKSVGGMRLPDGLFQLFDHSGIIDHGSEHSGMENIAIKLKEDKQKVYELLNTKNFVLNETLMRILKRGLLP